MKYFYLGLQSSFASLPRQKQNKCVLDARYTYTVVFFVFFMMILFNFYNACECVCSNISNASPLISKGIKRKKDINKSFFLVHELCKKKHLLIKPVTDN